MFYSEIISEYLLENYIIWPWNITYESNQNTLIEIWKEIFSRHFPIDLTKDVCPILIGIMRRSSEENDSSLASSYEFKILLTGDMLMHDHRTLNTEALSDMLVTFKKEFDENEQYLSFNFVRKTGLCRDIILEMIIYLSLNDAVTIFSLDILPLLRRYKIRLPIVEPSDTFMKTMIEKIDREQIVSLHLKENQLSSIMFLASSSIFTNIKSITLFNLQQMNQINEFKTPFPNLTCLSFRYDNQVDFHSLCKVFNHIQNPIKRLEIHCDSVRCSHRHTYIILSKIKNLNFTVESFVLDVTGDSMSVKNDCAQFHATCFLMTMADFIKIMRNIRYVRLTVNNINVEKLLDINEWKSLIITCVRLEKIKLKLIKNMPQNTQTKQNILEIQQKLSNVRHNIEFHVIS
ncbi:unnamed protein product [Rotaria sp. Silwood1]|nr:unnamed protein product [Rotaria sp. Silwood1]